MKVPEDALNLLKRGKQATFHSNRDVAAGSSQAAQPEVTQRAALRIHILERADATKGGWDYTAQPERRPSAERPRFLHRRPHRGYTTVPAFAVRGEPEALSDHDLAHVSMHAGQVFLREYHERIAKDEATRAAMSLTERLDRAIREARAIGIDTHRYEASIRDRVERLERKTRRDAA